MLVRSAVGVLAWCAYSLIQRRHLSKGRFAAMQLIAETRHPDGDQSQVLPLIEKLRPAKSGVPDDWIFLAGNRNNSMEIERCDSCTTVCATNDMVCRLSSDGSSFGLFGKRELTKNFRSLRELVASHTVKPKIYENIATRLNWMRNIEDHCVLATDSKTGVSAIRGCYSFCFRDYVNHEEFLAMMCRRYGIDNLLVRPTRSGRLIMEDDGKCILNERGIAFGFLPIRIDWEGHVEEGPGEIRWDTTSFRCGWKRLGKTFHKPKVAEALRTDPWIIYFPTDDGDDDINTTNNSGDIVVFRRKGSGKLVYARDEVLDKILLTKISDENFLF